jgi:hypothetical protein
MPAIAHLYRAHSTVERNDTHSDPNSEGHASLGVRIRTARHRGDLTRALADGVDPRSSEELSLRAMQLTGTGSRTNIARSMRRAVAEAHKPPMTRARMVIVRRPAVLEAEEAINAMIRRLREPQPVSARGMAIAELLLNDGQRSPLYSDAEPGSLRRAVAAATQALDPEPARLMDLAPEMR